MYKKLPTYYLAIFSALFLLWTGSAQATEEPVKQGSYLIKSIETNIQGDSLEIVLKGNSTPAYTMYELFAPARLVLDIANASLDASIDSANIIPENDFSTLKIDTLTDKTPQITRFEITLAENHSYKVDQVENDLSIHLFPKEGSSAVVESTSKTVPVLHDIVVRKNASQTEILLQADSPIENFRQDTVTGREGLADSMFIDINSVDGSELVREKTVGTSLAKIRVATRGSGVRVVFDSATSGLFSYDIKTVPQGLLVTINEEKAKPGKDSSVAKSNPAAAEAVASDPTLDALIDSSEAALNEQAQPS
ncbi:MAG: AMIN domain-containing protein, partial [Desulfocapsa sp.]|nr:AMIN domain-containing protein [Desulfocapsa sp.]